MREDDANALIARVRRSIAARTSVALQHVVTDLMPASAVVALAIRKPPFAELPETVAAVWTSHRLLYAADGMLYQLAICRAARQLEFDVHMCRRGEETSQAAQQLGVTPGEIEAFVGRTGRPSGPPLDAGAPACVRSWHRRTGPRTRTGVSGFRHLHGTARSTGDVRVTRRRRN